MWARCFPFLKTDLLKVDKILGLTFFKARKDFEGFETAFFQLLLLSFVLDGLPTTPVYSGRRDRFVNSAFPIVRKVWPQNQSIFMTNKFESKCLQKFSFSSKTGKIILQKDDVLPRATEPPFLSAILAKNDTTNLFGYIKLDESTENNKALLFFSGKETIQTLNGSI